MTFYWKIAITLGFLVCVFARNLTPEQAALRKVGKGESTLYTWLIRVPLRIAFGVYFMLAIWSVV